MRRTAVAQVTKPARRRLSTSALQPFQHTRVATARLASEGHISVSPADARRPPPLAPPPQKVFTRPPLPPIAPVDPSIELKRDLDAFLLRALAQVTGIGNQLGVAEMARLMDERSGQVLTNVDLAYESTPVPERRVHVIAGEPAPAPPKGQQADGIVVVAHVVGGVSPRVSVCSGFSIGASKADGVGATILTCSHTLQAVRFALPCLVYDCSRTSGYRSLPIWRHRQTRTVRRKLLLPPPSCSAHQATSTR